MSDLQLGPVIGRIGGAGAEVSEIPVNFTSPSSAGTYHVADVPVPEGKQARVIVLVYSASTSITTNTSVLPRLYIGGNGLALYSSDNNYQYAAISIVTGPVAVEVERRSTSSLYDPSFVGEIFWWEVDD